MATEKRKRKNPEEIAVGDTVFWQQKEGLDMVVLDIEDNDYGENVTVRYFNEVTGMWVKEEFFEWELRK